MVIDIFIYALFPMQPAKQTIFYLNAFSKCTGCLPEKNFSHCQAKHIRMISHRIFIRLLQWPIGSLNNSTSRHFHQRFFRFSWQALRHRYGRQSFPIFIILRIIEWKKPGVGENAADDSSILWLRSGEHAAGIREGGIISFIQER